MYTHSHLALVCRVICACTGLNATSQELKGSDQGLEDSDKIALFVATGFRRYNSTPKTSTITSEEPGDI